MSAAIMPYWQQKLKDFFDHSYVHGGLGILIVINMITLGIQVSESVHDTVYEFVLVFNDLVLLVFAAEIIGRILVEGRSFFKDGWHIFDFIIVSLALVSFGGVIQAFRALRILWLLRFLTIAPPFKRLINTILLALPNALVVAVLLILATYIAALVATFEFSSTNKEYADILTSMGTLATTVLMEHTWVERYEALVEHYPHAWAFVFPTMIILNYLLLHLVIGVIVTALHRQYEEEQEEKKHLFLMKFFQKEHNGHENPFSPETKAILQSIEELRSEMRRKDAQGKE